MTKKQDLLIILTLTILFFSCGKDNNDLSVTPLFEIGELAHGGMVFYVDETGEHGLVSALEDVIDGSSDSIMNGYLGYEWGCYNEYVPGADNELIGYGYQNTLDILDRMCESENGGQIAARIAFDYVSDGYNDWYLPSINELNEMYFTIGFKGEESNLGDFLIDAVYWSSTEAYQNSFITSGAKSMRFNNHLIPSVYSSNKNQIYRVRPIRSF
jgi:hypothetical protein